LDPHSARLDLLGGASITRARSDVRLRNSTNK
jgi:hypothetical protein